MKGTYIFLADGFEISEALTTVNMLRRGGVNVKTVSIYDDRIVTSSNRIPVVADMAFGEFRASTTFGPCLPSDVMIYLINTLLFEAKWELGFNPDYTRTREFTAYADTVQFEWLPLLSIQERQLLWKRYSGMGWKRLAGEAKVCERTVRNYINKALEKLYRKLR